MQNNFTACKFHCVIGVNIEQRKPQANIYRFMSTGRAESICISIYETISHLGFTWIGMLCTKYNIRRNGIHFN